MSNEEVVVDLNGCARCDGEGHAGLSFKPFVIPIVDGDGEWSHWASCPETSDPILMRFGEKA